MRNLRFAAAITLLIACILPTASSAQLADHLECFGIKDPLAKAVYTADLDATMAGIPDAVGCTIKTPAKMLCVDVTKENVTPAPPGGVTADAAQRYLCYKAKCTAVAASVNAQDQFGTRAVTTKSTKLLCAPLPALPAPTTTTTMEPTTTTTLGAGACPSSPSCDGGESCAGNSDCRSGSCVADSCTTAGFVEVEPNEDGTPSTNTIDFSSANANGPFTGDITVSGSVSPTGDEDYFAVHNSGAGSVLVRYETFTSPGACTVDTVLRLHDGFGSVLSQDDQSGINSCSRLFWDLAPGETLYVGVLESGDNASIPGYLLEIDFQ